LTHEQIRQLTVDLASADYGTWHETVHRLARVGAEAVSEILTEMRQRADNPEYCARAGMTLKAMGPRRARAVVDALERIDEPGPLLALVDVVGAFGEKPSLYRLRGLIERVGRRCAEPTEREDRDALQRLRARAHLELARIGSRVSIQDLREQLALGPGHIEPELLSAVALIGMREEIGLLVRAYDGGDAFLRERIALAVRAIVKRERIRRNSAFLRTLGASPKELLEILPPRPARPSRPRSREHRRRSA
jgi:hypothetical protein